LIRFIDLFAGTGGIRLGFEAAARNLGLETECVLSSEINPKSRQTYELNFSDAPLGDIHEIKEIPDFDFLLGGFPCQPFSYAGKQKGFGDTRGTLFFEIERILSSHKPKGFLLENVRGLTTHDGGKTFQTILKHLRDLGYGVTPIVMNASSMGVPQNRVRVYILGLLGKDPITSIKSDLGATDSHNFKKRLEQTALFGGPADHKVVGDVLEDVVDEKYYCSDSFTKALVKATNGNLEKLHGMRLIDYRGGNSIHSWELGLKGDCTDEEIDFMNALIRNRRLSRFGDEQDGKRLSIDQISTFFPSKNLKKIINSLEKKGYIKQVDGKFNPVAGNMSFEVFKFLDPGSVSITLVSSDAHKLGVVHKGIARRITPREAARLQGYPDSFKIHPEDSVAYFQFGNAVAVPVVEKIMEDFFICNEFRPSN
jgi:DNA (cytosine-5)-methyltransferase 1